MSDNPEIDSPETESPVNSPAYSKSKQSKNKRLEQMRKNIKSSLFKTGKSQSCKTLIEQAPLKPVLTHSESTVISRSSRIDAIRSNLKNSFFAHSRPQVYGVSDKENSVEGDANSNRVDSPHSQHSLENVRSPYETSESKFHSKAKSISTQGDENDTYKEESKSNTMDAINEEEEHLDNGFQDQEGNPTVISYIEDNGSEELFDPNQSGIKHSIFFSHIDNEIDELKTDLEVADDPNVHFIEGDFMSYYTEGDVLGEGTTATVKKCQKNGTDEWFAVKIVHYRDDNEILCLIVREFKNHRKLEHKNIIRVFEIYIDYFTKKIYTILELAECTEMFEVLQDLGHYSEAVACSIFKQILAGIHYMHTNGVCHRDLKPNNILVSRDGKIVKITDFNVSKFIEKKNEKFNFNSLTGQNYKMWTYTGTIAFTAPEVFTDLNYTEAVDMWSAGVVLYTMLCGYQPFNSEYVQDLIDEIKIGKFEFHPEPWDGISLQAKELIRHCLDINPKTRYTSPQALLSDWITSAGKMSDSNIQSCLDNLKKNGNRLILASRDSDTSIPLPRVKTGVNLKFKSPVIERRFVGPDFSGDTRPKAPMRTGTLGSIGHIGERNLMSKSHRVTTGANSIVLEENDENQVAENKKLIDSLEYLRSVSSMNITPVDRGEKADSTSKKGSDNE